LNFRFTWNSQGSFNIILAGRVPHASRWSLRRIGSMHPDFLLAAQWCGQAPTLICRIGAANSADASGIA
jgi:hypothetical protein